MNKKLKFYLSVINFLVFANIASAKGFIYDYNLVTLPLAGISSSSGAGITHSVKSKKTSLVVETSFNSVVSNTFPIINNPSILGTTLRRVISPTSPMYLIHVDSWSDQPQQIIDLIPSDIRPYVVINISLSTSILGDKGFDCAESWLNTCAQNGIWAMVQVSSGIQNAFAADTNLSAYESLYIKYPNFIGYNFCEQSWGFDSATFQQRLNLFTNLLEMGNKYGGYLYVNDCFSISNAGFNTISKFKSNSAFANATKLYKANMIYGNKYTNSWGYYDNESGALGAFLSGHAGNYAIRYDMYSWGWSGKGQVFGAEAPAQTRNPDGNRSLFACPEAVMGVPIVEQMMITGATVIDGPEVPWMSTFYKSYKLPPFDNMIADILRKIKDGTIRIPTVNEVAARTKVVFVNDVDANTTNTLFSSLYAMDATDGTDGMLKNNRTWFKKSGRYATIPQLYSDSADEISLFSPGTVFVKKSQYQTLWPTETQKVTQFNSLYSEVSTGDMYVSRLNNSLYAYNPWLNTNTTTSATIPLKYNTCSSVELSYEPHTFSVINESANKLQIYLNNYRTDKNQLWNDYPTDFSWYRLQTTILPSYADTPSDGTFRTSVIKVNGSTSQPTYTMYERGSHKASSVSVNWANGVYTLTIVHNGPVDISIDCSGTATGRATAPALVDVVAPVAPIAYTGEKEYEAEGAIVTSPAAVNTTALPIAYHGTGFVRFSNTTSSASSVKFKVINAEVTGNYDLDIRYAALSNVNLVDIFVNGTKVGTPTFVSTGSESTYAIFNQKVVLNQGTNNTIELKANAAEAVINIDKITVTKAAVPFSFVSVEAVQKNSSGIQLTWNVDGDRNLLRYEVLKSTDGINYTSISNVNAQNNGTANSYVYLDNTAQQAVTNYYKIKAIDNNAVETISVVAQVNIKTAVGFQAESGVLGSDWDTLTASGITYETSKTDVINSNYPGDSSKVISYTVTFEKPGTYDLYAKVWVGVGGASDDSFYYGKLFGSLNPLADANEWVTSNNLGGVGYSVETDVVGTAGTVGSGQWKWINVSKYNGGETPVTFTVVDGAFTQTFQVGGRENGLQIDKFVYGSSTESYTVKELEGFEKKQNSAPVAVANQITVVEGSSITTLVGGETNVLVNDTDADSNSLTAVLVSNVSNGTLTLNSNGTFTYIHNGSETTTDSFTYKAFDGALYSNVVTVNITITPVNDAPVAIAETITVAEGATVIGTTILANDTDPENNSLTAVLVSNVTNGTLTLNSNGTFTYIHNGSETTTDSFTYKAFDGALYSNVVTVNITITPVNDAPIAIADGIMVLNRGTSTVLVDNSSSVLNNDTDTENNSLTAVLVSNVINGTLTLNINGTFTYVHDGTNTTLDSFTYKVFDGTSYSNVVTVTITIVFVNHSPIAISDSITVAEGDTVNGATVLVNDTDSEYNTLTAVLVSNATNGTLTLNSNGTFKYTHNGSETTTDSFTYKAFDGALYSNVVTVNIIITPVNDAPIAIAETITVTEGRNTYATTVLANDTDAENNSLTAVLVSNVTNGTLTLNSNGTFTYIHNGSETTTDSFTYKAFDGALYSNVVTVNITITPVNDAPVAIAETITVTEGSNANGTTVLANDTDPENNSLTAVLVSNVTNGTLALNSNGTFTYIHNGSETTTDSFTYKAFDGALYSNVVTVNITITPVNDAPIAIAEIITVAEGGTANGTTVLANDTDAENNTLTAVLVSNVTNGTLILNSNGIFSYVHNGSETTSDSFTYKANDGTSDSNEVTVTITVTPVNDVPVATADTISLMNGATSSTLVSGATTVLANDKDADNNTLTAVLVSNVTNGTLTLNSNGTFSYVHNGSNTTSDSFTYKANDGTSNSNVITVNITIVPFTVVSNNFTIESKSETCANKNNGEIIINAQSSYNYVAKINGTNYPFVNNSLTISNLAPATYSVCVTIADKSFEQCFSITIGKGGTISGKSSLSSNKLAVEITQGTAPFEIVVNGVSQFETAASSFTVDAKQGDLLEVKTVIPCEGIYVKRVMDIITDLVVYPNPTHGWVEISIPTTQKEVKIELYATSGQLISTGTYTLVNEKTQLNLEKLSTGIYSAKVYLDIPTSVRIIKK